MLASIPDEVVAELLKAAPSSPPRRRAVHSRLHPFGSPLPFMGEGLGERAEKAAKLPVSPFKWARGLIASDHFSCEQHYRQGGLGSGLHAGLAWHAQGALGDDVALDLVAAAIDRVGAGEQKQRLQA